MKTCSNCGNSKPENAFRVRGDNGKLRNECRKCESQRANKSLVVKETPRDPTNPRDAKELAMKRMLSGAKFRAQEKGLMFNLHYDDIQIPNLCPVLKIPLIPSQGMSDGSPSLDRMVPYLGYVKGNVRVISMKANRIKTDATSLELHQVLEYVKQIEQENT
tara:strand:+ start:3209 stop:3691 length:483 start_codon:yes stop_codon:yes gene_type:complete